MGEASNLANLLPATPRSMKRHHSFGLEIDQIEKLISK
jgi:hypothetical protein